MANDSKKGALITEKIEIEAVHSNLTTEVIKITSDKLKLILTQHLSNLEKRKEWWTPFSLLIAILIIFPTTDFKDSFSIKATTWEAFFMMFLLLMLIWLIFSGWKAFKAKSISDIINLIKSDNN